MGTLVQTKFWHYRQNNSFGKMLEPDINVIIEAISPDHANDIAEDHGVYFDGCDSGIDCSCCGDRWSRQYSYDKGSDVPMVYYQTIPEYMASTPFMYGNSVTLVKLDGSVEKFRDSE